MMKPHDKVAVALSNIPADRSFPSLSGRKVSNALVNDNIDVNAGTIIEGTETNEQVGDRLFEEIIEVCSGKLTKAEILKQHGFGIWRIGPTF